MRFTNIIPMKVGDKRFGDEVGDWVEDYYNSQMSNSERLNLLPVGTPLSPCAALLPRVSELHSS